LISQGVPQLGGVKHQSCAQWKTDRQTGRQTLLPVDNGPLSVSSVDSYFPVFGSHAARLKRPFLSVDVSVYVCVFVCSFDAKYLGNWAI